MAENKTKLIDGIKKQAGHGGAEHLGRAMSLANELLKLESIESRYVSMIPTSRREILVTVFSPAKDLEHVSGTVAECIDELIARHAA